MDKKIESFLTLCRTMNYREAAEKLHLTQPAVTKQIQSLEAEYDVKLFEYDGRRLHKTEKCKVLETYAQSLEYNYREMQMAMRGKDRLHLRVGATKTIGDYVIGDMILDYLMDPSHELTLLVDNTEQLLSSIDENEIDFAFVEGRFDKKKYQYSLFRKEPFIGVRSAGGGDAHDAGLDPKSMPGDEETYADSDIEKHSGDEAVQVKINIEDLLGETIIVREKGSGTREMFERDLNSLGYPLSSFARVIELSSFKLIVEAVKAGLGISFLYESVVENVPGIEKFTVNEIGKEHEFNIVSLKNTPAQKYAELFMGSRE